MGEFLIYNSNDAFFSFSVFPFLLYIKQIIIWSWMIQKERMMQELISHAPSVMLTLKFQCFVAICRRSTALTWKMRYVSIYNVWFHMNVTLLDIIPCNMQTIIRPSKLSLVALSSILIMWLFQVCPLCAASLGKDVIGHFTLQHAHSLKVFLTRGTASGC